MPHPLILRFANLAALGIAIFANSRFKSTATDVWIVPARYAFAVWGVVYMLLVGFVVFQFLPGTLKKTGEGAYANAYSLVQERMSIFFAASCLLNALWVYCYVSGFRIISFAVILLLIPSVGIVWYRTHPYSRNMSYGVHAIDQSDVESTPLIGQPMEVAQRDPIAANLLVKLPFSIYFGWLICVTVVSFFSVFFPISPENPSATLTASLVALVLLTAVSLALLVKFQDLPLTLVAVWAISSIPNNVPISKYPGADAEMVVIAAKVCGALLGFGCALLAVLSVAAATRKYLKARST